jgi:hypothetical protein
MHHPAAHAVAMVHHPLALRAVHHAAPLHARPHLAAAAHHARPHLAGLLAAPGAKPTALALCLTLSPALLLHALLSEGSAAIESQGQNHCTNHHEPFHDNTSCKSTVPCIEPVCPHQWSADLPRGMVGFLCLSMRRTMIMLACGFAVHVSLLSSSPGSSSSDALSIATLAHPGHLEAQGHEAHSCSSLCGGPNAGIPVIFNPFLTIQKISASLRSSWMWPATMLGG